MTNQSPESVIAEVIEYHADTIGSHYDGCYKHHVVCLAVKLRDMLREPSEPNDDRDRPTIGLARVISAWDQGKQTTRRIPHWAVGLAAHLIDSGHAVDRATVPDAATEAKQPDGWSTEDRQESKQEAERRWVDERSGYKSDYNRGCINGFILGAEWQKARETFISFRSIADEARAERDAALASIERVRAIHRETGAGGDCVVCKEWGWPCPTVAALDGAPEPGVKP